MLEEVGSVEAEALVPVDSIRKMGPVFVRSADSMLAYCRCLIAK